MGFLIFEKLMRRGGWVIDLWNGGGGERLKSLLRTLRTTEVVTTNFEYD
jgi:hypothetical protein